MTRARRRLVVLGSASAAAVALFPFTARALQWDEVAYMDLAFCPAPQAWILNRYAHAYAMKPFMALAGDPYVGAQAFWCFLFGVTVGAIVDAALRLPSGERGRVLGLTLFLLAGQAPLFRYPGLPYADYTIMAVFTVSVCIALRRVLEGCWTPSAACALGVLFLFGMKSKEVALPLLVLPALLFVGPTGRPRVDRGTVVLAASWILGALGAQLVLVVLDGVLLGDPLFGVRPTSWAELLSYNLRPEINGPTSDTWLGLMLAGSSPSLVLYLLAGPLWLARKRDVRLPVLYALPLAFLLLLAFLRGYAAMDVAARYVIPILPLVCFLGAIALWEAAADVRWQRALAWVALAAVVVTGLRPLHDVLTVLLERRAQRQGASRFAGFYQVARSVDIEDDASVFVSPRLYDGAIRARALISFARLNFNRPLPRRQIATEGKWSDQQVDYAVLSAPEYAAWSREGRTADARQVVASDDGAVVLLCLRAPCVRQP